MLADLNLKPDEPARLLEFRSPAGGFELLLDRRWHVMIEREDVSVLRMVDRGDLIAQANISALPPLEQGEAFTIVDFQQDVKRALADHFGEFVTASESVTDSGLHVMRVVTTGKIDGAVDRLDLLPRDRRPGSPPLLCVHLRIRAGRTVRGGGPVVVELAAVCGKDRGPRHRCRRKASRPLRPLGRDESTAGRQRMLGMLGSQPVDPPRPSLLRLVADLAATLLPVLSPSRSDSPECVERLPAATSAVRPDPVNA